MSKDYETQEDDLIEETGPTCLYRDGEARVFEGSEVEEMLDNGWLDHPEPAADAVAEDAPKPKAKPKAKGKAKSKAKADK